MNYNYEIKKVSPKQEFMSVVYTSDGYPDYLQSFNPTQFDEEHLLFLIKGNAQRVIEFWLRWEEHPENLSIPFSGSANFEPPEIEDFDPNHIPEVEPEPEIDHYTQRLEMEEYTHASQKTLGWNIIELTEEEKETTLNNFKSLFRDQRNRLILETDHWMMSDTPEPTQAQLDYRQALRDVPAQAEFPQNIVWPTKPE